MADSGLHKCKPKLHQTPLIPFKCQPWYLTTTYEKITFIEQMAKSTLDTAIIPFSALDHFFLGLLALYIYILHSTTKAMQIYQQYLALYHPHKLDTIKYIILASYR